VSEKLLIYKKLQKASESIGAVGKNRKFDAGERGAKFKFRGIDDALNACHEAFIEHGITAVPEVLEERREERETKTGSINAFTIIKARTTFYCAEDGSSTSCVTLGEGMDSSDKGSGKAMAVAFKYALFYTLMIPVEGMPEPEDHDEELAPRRPQQGGTAGGGKVADDPMSQFWAASRAAGQSKQEGAAFLNTHGGDPARAVAALSKKD
jgi:hypothetical protein